MNRLMNFSPNKFAVKNVYSNPEYSKLQKLAKKYSSEIIGKASSRALASHVAAVDHSMVNLLFHAWF